MLLAAIDALVHVLIIIIAVFSILSLVLSDLLNFIRSRIQNLVGLLDLALNQALKSAHLLSCLAATWNSFNAKVDHSAAYLHSLIITRN